MALLVLLAIMFLLVGFGFSIWAAMGISGVVYILIRGGYSLKVVISSLFNGVDNQSLLAIPLFILAGELMNRAGITKKLADFAEYFVGRLKGGLAYVAIIVNVIMAGISGSAIADATAVSSVLLPAMKEKKYDPEFSASINAAAAVIGPIIPPSIPMIFLGAISGLSIGKLFLGGFIPGLMMALFLAVNVFLSCRKMDLPTAPEQKKYTFASLFGLFKESFLAIIAPVIVILGVVLGIVTVVEVAVLANVYILLISLFVYRSIKWRDLFGIIGRAVIFSSTMMILFGIVGLYQYIAVSEQLDLQVMNLITAAHLPAGRERFLPDLGLPDGRHPRHAHLCTRVAAGRGQAGNRSNSLRRHRGHQPDDRAHHAPRWRPAVSDDQNSPYSVRPSGP
jgi:tripartite ATP-independent transporter DctM subunit